MSDSTIISSILPCIYGRTDVVYHRLLFSFDGVNEEKRHVVNACFLRPPCKAIFLGPQSKIQLCPEGLARADALGLFHCKDRDSFEDCLRGNDAIPSREQRSLVRQQLAETKHAKLLLKTDQPVGYTMLSDVKIYK